MGSDPPRVPSDAPLSAAELEAIEARSLRLRRRIRAVVALPGEKAMPDTLGVAGDGQAVADVVEVIRDVPRLIAEIRRLHGELAQSERSVPGGATQRRARARRPNP
jgi:hypothetical protein